MKRASAALFSWSLRADAHSTIPHVVRGAFALFVLLSVSVAYADALSTVGPGLRFFGMICYLNVALITVAGMSYFVSAVTEEKDAGTLALLRLAGAPPLGIVLSKSTSRLISALMLMLIQLPFTFLSVTLGGVTWFQIIAAYLALTAWLCLIANIALLCSVTAPTSGRAAAHAITILLLFFAVGPAAKAVATVAPSPRWLPASVPQVARHIHEWQQILSVNPRLEKVLSPAGVPSLVGPHFWWSMLTGGILFILSVLLFNRYTGPAPPALTSRSRHVRRFAVSRAWSLSVVWKDFLFFTGGIPAFMGRCLLYGGLVGGFVAVHEFNSPQSRLWLTDSMTWLCFLIVVGCLTLEGLFYSSGLLVHESDQGTLGPLRLIPSETVWILAQKLIACGIAMMPGAMAIAALLIINGTAVFTYAPTTAFIWYLFQFLLCAHLTMLLSLRSRWAALPVALFLTAASNLCFPVVIIAFTSAVQSMARINGVAIGGVAVTLINVAWAWMFVLLPLEIETVKAWNRAAESS
jgi:hypothetical protein